MIRTLVVGLILMALSPAGAQPARRPEAEQLFRAGEQMFNKGAYAEAAALFEEAHAILPLPAIGFSAAQAYRLQYFADDDPRRLKRAIELYEQYIAELPTGPRKADAVQSLAELKPRLDRIEAEARGPVAAMPMPSAASRLIVTSQTAGALVSVDGAAAVAAPFSGEVRPGKHRIQVTADGYVAFDDQRDVFDGQSRVVEVELEARPARVAIDAPGGAQIAVDGRTAATAPLGRPLELPAGKHVITVTRRGHRPWTREVELGRGEDVAFAPDLVVTGQRKLAYGVFVASASTVVVAGIVGALAINAGREASALEDRRDSTGLTSAEYADYLGLVDRYERRRDLGLALLGVGSGLAVTGALLYLLDQPRAEVDELVPTTHAGLDVMPIVDGRQAGLAVGGAF